MYNKGSFNSLHYNRQSLTQSPVVANARMAMRSSKVETRIHKYNKGSSSMAMGSKGQGLTIKAGGTSEAHIVASSPLVNQIIEKYITSKPSHMIMRGIADHALSGEEYIELVDHQGKPLVLEPSDELLIDTCNMTVTVNGVNGMKYFSDNSRFFLLNQGINDIIYTDASNKRTVEIDVLWKDRWL